MAAYRWKSFNDDGDRPEKPRRYGVTEMKGPHYSLFSRGLLEDVFESMGQFVDGLKLCDGSHTSMPKTYIKEVTDMAHKHNVYVSSGDCADQMLRQGPSALKEYIEECKQLGFDTIELDVTSLGLPEETLLRYVRLIKSGGLRAKPQFSVKFNKSDIAFTGDRAFGAYVIPAPQTSDVIFTRIMACETPKEVWEKIKEEFDGSDRVKAVKLLTLKREFEMLRMKEGDTVKEYSAKLLEIVNKIRLFGETFPDSKVVEKMMISLPARFESKISAIEESCDLKTLSVAELISKLQAQEQRSSIRDEEAAKMAFQAQHKGKQPVKDNRRMEGDRVAKEKTWKESSKKGKFPPCSHCKRTNHQEKDCWFRGKPSIQCRFCKKMGHIEKNCRIKQNQPQQSHVQQTNFVEKSEKEEESLFMASHEGNTTSKSSWFIDSGYTSHMSHNELLFRTLDKSFKTKVRMRNGETVDAHGKGSVAFQTTQEMVEDVDLLVRRAERCLEAGADMIMINADDLCRQADFLRSDMVAKIVGRLGLEKTMFEASNPKISEWFVKRYGPKVNLFVDHSQVMDLECLRGRNLGQNHSSVLGRSYFLL